MPSATASHSTRSPLRLFGVNLKTTFPCLQTCALYAAYMLRRTAAQRSGALARPASNSMLMRMGVHTPHTRGMNSGFGLPIGQKDPGQGQI